MELSPAVIPGDISLVLVFGQWKADVEAGWNPVSPQHADERRMEVCTVAVLGVTGPHRVPASPACARLVVAHSREQVIISSLGLCDRAALGPGYLYRQLLDPAIRRNQIVRFNQAVHR